MFSDHTKKKLDLGSALERVEQHNRTRAIENGGQVFRSGSTSPTAIESTQPRANVPAHVSNVRVQQFQTDENTTRVTVAFNRDPSDRFHRKTRIYLKGYKGTLQPVEVASGDSPISFAIENTGENISVLAQASGDRGDAYIGTAPSGVLRMARNSNLPSGRGPASVALSAPTSLAVTASPLGNVVTWQAATGGNVHSYQVYRATSNSFAAASRLGTVAFSPAAKATFVDKGATTGTLYYYFATTVNTSQNEGPPSASVNATAAKANLDTHVEDGTARKARTAGHSSYRPTTNPLTATDAGANTTVNVAAFTQRVGGTDISVNSGSVSALSYSTLYFLYYDDGNFAGGAVSYSATTTKETALNGDSRFYVGSILTPASGGADTQGNNDGGAGAQVGGLDVSRPTVGGALAYDNNFVTSKNTVDNDTLVTPAFDVYSAFTPISRAVSATSIKLKTNTRVIKVNGAGANTTGTLEYSTNSGSSWTTIFTVTGTTARAVTTDIITLPLSTNIANVQVKASATYIAGAHTTSVSVATFEAWIEITS